MLATGTEHEDKPAQHLTGPGIGGTCTELAGKAGAGAQDDDS